MKRYRNKSKISGVTRYESNADSILVKFTDSDRIYTYSYLKAGKVHVEKIKQLAIAGRGLSTYISRYVRINYEKVASH